MHAHSSLWLVESSLAEQGGVGGVDIMVAQAGGMSSEVGLFVPYARALYPFMHLSQASADGCMHWSGMMHVLSVSSQCA